MLRWWVFPFWNRMNHVAYTFVLQVAGYMQTIDKRLIAKTHSLVTETRVHDLDELQRHLEVYMRSLFPPPQQLPPQSNRRFYPKKSDIKNHQVTVMLSMRWATLIDSFQLKITQPYIWELSSLKGYWIYITPITPSVNNLGIPYAALLYAWDTKYPHRWI